MAKARAKALEATRPAKKVKASPASAATMLAMIVERGRIWREENPALPDDPGTKAEHSAYRRAQALADRIHSMIERAARKRSPTVPDLAVLALGIAWKLTDSCTDLEAAAHGALLRGLAGVDPALVVCGWDNPA